MLSGTSIGQQMERYKTTSGFDYLRLFLAIGVLLVHSVLVSYGRDAERAYVWLSPVGPFARMLLPMFFVLSGFLVAGSIFRTGSVVGFVMLRVMRIFPALGVEVFLSAAVLGAFFTKMPISEYYSSDGFASYFKNIYGDIHFYLPGVFSDNPFQGVMNQSLWTIPSEFKCYTLIVALMVLGIIRFRWAVLGLLVLGCAYRFVEAEFFTNFSETNVGSVAPTALVLEFLAGICFYLYRDEIKLSKVFFGAFLLLSLILHYKGAWVFLGVFPVAYVTIYLGMQVPKKLPFIFDGDYSYGVYLYAFPVQQVIANLLPSYREWWLNAALTLPVTFLFSYCSWHLLEKHVLKLKGQAKVSAFLPRMELALVARIKRLVQLGIQAVSLRSARTDQSPAQRVSATQSGGR